jgi:hypothetical protein
LMFTSAISALSTATPGAGFVRIPAAVTSETGCCA